MLYCSPDHRPVVSAPAYFSGTGSRPLQASAARMNACSRVSSSVDLTDSRTRAAAATSGDECSCNFRNASSVLASAGVIFRGLVGEGFMGTSTWQLSSSLLNRAAEAISDRTNSATASSSDQSKPTGASASARSSLASSSSALCFWSRSTDSAASTSDLSSTNLGLTSICVVRWISMSSSRGNPLTSLRNSAAHCSVSSRL